MRVCVWWWGVGVGGMLFCTCALIINFLCFKFQDRSVRQFLLKNLKRSADNSFKWHINLDAIINNFDSLHSFPQLSAPCSINTIFIGGAESRHMKYVKTVITEHCWFGPTQ